MKQGSRITTVRKLTIFEQAVLVNYNAQSPVHKKVYVVDRVTKLGSLIIEGLNHGNSGGWKTPLWRELPKVGQSSEASREIMDLFKERDGCPETHPDEKEYLPEEEIFTTTEDF